jgi:hypothetical protein
MQNAEEIAPRLFPAPGTYHVTRLKIEIPVAVQQRIFAAARPYAKYGVSRGVFMQIFLNGFDYIEKSCGLEQFVRRFYEQKNSEKKVRRRGRGARYG